MRFGYTGYFVKSWFESKGDVYENMLSTDIEHRENDKTA
jgi:hypothetical protein